MGRLIDPVSNDRARSMIEFALQPAKQNPAYRFAAVKTPLSVYRKGLFFIY